MTDAAEDGSFDVLPLVRGGSLILSSHPNSFTGLTQTAVVALYVEHGAKVLLSLTTEQELLFLNLGELAAVCRSQDILWMHSPIEDLETPDESFEVWWAANRAVLHDFLNNGHAVAIHCWSGYGRSGTIAARLLLERGLTPEEAIATVRAKRPGSIETMAQEQYILSMKRAK